MECRILHRSTMKDCFIFRTIVMLFARKRVKDVARRLDFIGALTHHSPRSPIT
ncbi:hypothetical protein SS05631_c11920 [Sinorhizobium sp. CCBAU 05631]|uniref:Uncharacterized protein n=1 Tax=Rhizobium fredii TaxID=380 RepID=A0A2L0H3Q1_RHIFR|nr:hypothetical protein SS05631_c11920 [Sinorhizobium sp. CCBAU 05631]AUX76064.1 hypothetical protein NXT3_CH01482 [Sinorhizobium fredii]